MQLHKLEKNMPMINLSTPRKKWCEHKISTKFFMKKEQTSLISRWLNKLVLKRSSCRCTKWQKPINDQHKFFEQKRCQHKMLDKCFVKIRIDQRIPSTYNKIRNNC